MKFHPLTLAALASASVTASNASAASMISTCETVVRTSVAALTSGSADIDDRSGAATIDKGSLDGVQITNVKVLKTQCIGPAECDAQHPDAFTYGVDIGRKGDGLHGKMVVSYHRGFCFVEKVSLEN